MKTILSIDGGVFINSPSVSAYAEAKKLFSDETDFFVLSLGTGELIRPIAFAEAKDWGKTGWLAPLLGCMFDGAADAANYQMKMFLGSQYVRMQTSLSVASDDMDNATHGNVENLKAEANTFKKQVHPIIDSLLDQFAVNFPGGLVEGIRVRKMQDKRILGTIGRTLLIARRK